MKSNAPNIMIHKIIKEKNNQSYTVMKVKESTCVVVPINEQGLTYCTGHTSIVEALALGKPVIVTDNIYHPIDVEKEAQCAKDCQNARQELCKSHQKTICNLLRVCDDSRGDIPFELSILIREFHSLKVGKGILPYVFDY